MRPNVAALLLWGLATGLFGLRWGLPGPERLRAFPESLRPTPEIARQVTDAWTRLYQGIERTHKELKTEEPVTYVQGVVRIKPGWTTLPDALINSYRSALLRSENPDEQKPLLVLARMRPWKLEFKPLYVHYGGAFIYALGAFLKTASVAGAVALVPDMNHYLLNPGDMGALYLCGRVLIVLFHVASLWVLYDIGRRLSGHHAGLLAALFFSLSPIALVNSHNLKPHPYSAFWCLAALRFMLVAYESGKRRDYLACGLCVGVGAGANFSLACFGMLPFLAWAWRAKAARAKEWREPLLAAAVTVGTFVLANPYAVFSHKDYLWELTVYPGARSALDWGTVSSFWGAGLTSALGAALYAAALAGFVWSARSKDARRRLLCLAAAACFAVLWTGMTFLWGFISGTGATRFFYPLVALGCVFAADALLNARLPAPARVAALAAVLLDSGLRGGVYLLNMRLDSGPASTRASAAAWLETHAPAGASVGLTRYPQPAHTPSFRYDRFELVVFDKADSFKGKGYPDFVVADGFDRPRAEELPGYEPAASFLPAPLGWAKVTDDSFFANTPMFVYRRKGARS